MKTKEFEDLKRGDIVKHAGAPGCYVVTGNYGGRVTAVTTIDMINPAEWMKVK